MQISVHFSCSVVSDCLRPHEPQHARPPCPSPTPGVYPNSCPLSWHIQPFHPLSPLLLLPSIFPSIRFFSNESALFIRWPKYWSFSFNISPSNEHPGLISFRCTLMMYSAYKLNKQGDNIQPWRTPFPNWNQSVVPCPVLTVLPDLHTGFSRDTSGGLVFPSLEEFSTVYCDPHSQRLWHSQ